MSSTMQVVRVLLSSPGNLSDDREIFRRVVEEINLDHGRRDGFVVECVGWETHTRPAAGEYPQGVINSQLPNDIDIFVGLMGAHFGTPTSTWGSGTEEEFRIAYEAHKRTGSPKICFYFSEASPQLRNIDADQLKRRQDFMKELPKLGVLYWTYEETMQFQFEVRRHLSDTIHEVLDGRSQILDTAIPLTSESIRSLPHYDNLLLENPLIAAEDLIFEASDWLGKHTDSQKALTKECSRLAHNLNKSAKKMNSPMNLATPERAIGVFQEFTDHLSSYQRHLRRRIPEMKESIEKSINSLQRGIEIIVAQNLRSKMPFDSAFQPMEGLVGSLEGLRSPIANVNAEMGKWRSMPLDLELQHKRVLALHDDLINYVEIACGLMRDFLSEYGSELA